MSDVTLAMMPHAIRALTLDAVKAANSGHSGMPMGMADVATALFTRHIKLDPSKPDWPDRDRFVLSAGHGSMLIYALNHLLGYEDMPMDEIRNFRQLGRRTAGHPEHGHAAGIETTTGPLGQGLATAVGMALAERVLNARFGPELVDHHTYVIAGDGCLMEGVSHEAIDLAGHLRLSKLIVFFDDNKVTIDGPTALSTSMDQKSRFAAAGWNVIDIEGHDMDMIDAAIETAKASDKPTMINCTTIIGFGAPTLAGKAKAHGAITGDDEIAGTKEALGWDHPPFEVPEDVLTAWREAGKRCIPAREAWENVLSGSTHMAEFEAAMAGEMNIAEALAAYRRTLAADMPKVASRKASEMTLDIINGATQLTIGGSADLTGSNNTKTAQTAPIEPGVYDGRYVYFGVREHGMAAAMNGLALHGGLVPYGGTFLVFTDYARAAIRLSALMKQRVIYVMTHDSIGLGEDGPTHQPVEQVAALRAMPNLNVFRPCDAMETAECWEVALAAQDAPSVIALSRQGLPALRSDAAENRSAKGGYVLRDTDGNRDVTLLATGSEVSLAVEAAEALAGDGIKAAVVSMPCWEVFDAQDASYRAETLGTAPRIAVEAGIEMGWSKYTGNAEAFIGMSGFGASAPAGELFKHFGITADAVSAKAKALIGRS